MLRFVPLILLLPFYTLNVFSSENQEEKGPYAIAQDSSRYFVVDNIKVIGNKVTKKHIILRELSFSQKDTVMATEVDQRIKSSENMLMNSSLFNFAHLVVVPTATGHADILVVVTERWYTWPIPIFQLAEPNFNTWLRNREFSRSNYGFYIERSNFRGRKETLRLKVQGGFTRKLAVQYLIPYIDKRQNMGLGMTMGYSTNREVNYQTLDNERVFFKDMDNDVQREFFSRLSLTHRSGLFNINNFELQFTDILIGDTVAELMPDYLNNGARNAHFMSFSWNFKREKRDYAPYPLTGYFFSTQIKKHGLGVLDSDDLNLLFHFFTLSKHWQLSNRFYLAGGIKTRVSLLDNPPYYLQQGLGYQDYVRGYEYYVMDGQHYGLFKANLKYELLKPRMATIPYLKSEKFNKINYAFYLNLFTDFGYVHDQLYHRKNPLSNQWLYSTGIGLDYVTYYDTVFRLEYAVNRMGETGVFLHFSKPI